MASSNNNNNVRSVIELFCKILGDNGISDVRAETLRQGKFNRDVITKLMWKVLYDVVCFLDKKSTTCLHSSEAEKIPFVKRKLQNWGYLSKSFAELPSSLTIGSREILLAIGWVIQTQQLFSEIIHRRTNPLNQDILSFATQKESVDGSPYPMHKLIDLPCKEKLQRQLMLCGKLKLKLRRLYASKQELARMHQTIKKSTVGVSIRPELNHLTPLEVFLLRYPDSLGRMVQILDEDNASLKRLLEWKEKDHVFWEWMDSVLTLHIQEPVSEIDLAQEPVKEESVFLDTPSDIGERISSLRSRLRDFILGHEDDIETLENLVEDKKISHGELELMNYQVEKELIELSKKFSQYEKGKFDIPGKGICSQESPIVKTNSVSSSTFDSGRRKSQRSQRHVPQTAQSIKARRETEVSELVQEEISALQKEVEKLEQELKQAQINNLKKLQNFAGNNISSICILPRYFKQFLQS